MKTIMEAEMYKFDHPQATGSEQTGDTNGTGSNGGSVSSLSPSTNKLDIVFDENLGREKPRGKLVRYQINPRANWGPMNRAAGNS